MLRAANGAALALVIALSGAAQAQAPAQKDVPIGTILAFAGAEAKIPANYLLCDGKKYDRTKGYQQLFDVVGSSWGGDGVNAFNVPDLRGLFLRGVDEQPKPIRDLDAAKRTAIHPGGHAGNDVGSYEPDDVVHHNHPANTPANSGGHSHPVNIGRSAISGSNNTRDVDQGNQKFNSDPGLGSLTASIPDGTGAHSHPVTIGDYGGNETRPKNAAVYWIIRAK